jgi:hypothetical protein
MGVAALQASTFNIACPQADNEIVRSPAFAALLARLLN